MIKFKDRSNWPILGDHLCWVDPCENEALRLWATEVNIVDVCEDHFRLLQLEAINK